MDIIDKLNVDVDALHKLIKEIDWFAKSVVKTRLLMIREHIIEAVKKIKEKTTNVIPLSRFL